MAISKKIKDEMLRRFQDQYGIMKPALHYNSPFELMIAVILSAQCTDERVNIVTAGMFPEYNTPEKMLTLGTEGLEEKIRTCGLYRSKAKNILANCAILCEKYHGQVPQTFDELVKLPGVGRKTANLILGDVYHKPAVVVDTHCIRLSNRMGLVDGLKDPVKIETALRKILPPEESSDFCHRLVLHGRAVCTARKPLCSTCCVRHVCQTAEEMEL